jgi:hypothetical protein
MGDSIGEAVQSADANQYTQPSSYLNFIAWRMGASFPLPLIKTNPAGFIESVKGRTRIDPTVEGLNLAVSGANAHSILYDYATATDVSQISDETELVLFPRTGSQIQIAESLMPQRIACWIGNNDVLGSVIAFNHLDASQLTPIADFTTDFTSLVQRLSAVGAKTVFGTVPNVTDIAMLADDADMVRFLGSDCGLPADSRTTIAAIGFVKLGLLDPSIFSDPNYVLDAGELATIQQQAVNLNNVIRSGSVPPVDLPTLGYVFLTDPFVDKDGDGRVRGRFLRGLIETLGPFMGISGDLNDSLTSPAVGGPGA